MIPLPSSLLGALAQGAEKNDWFTYAIGSSVATSATEIVTIVVTGVNDAPIAVDDEYETLSRNVLTGNLITNNTTNTENGSDYDPDEGDTLRVATVDSALEPSPTSRSQSWLSDFLFCARGDCPGLYRRNIRVRPKDVFDAGKAVSRRARHGQLHIYYRRQP